MSYFGGSGRMAGDPGFFGALKGAVGGLFTGGVSGAIGGAVRGFSSPQRQTQSSIVQRGQFTQPVTRTPGIRGAIQRGIPGGATGFQVGTAQVAGAWPTNKDGSPRRAKKDGTPWKRPTMNPTNPKALMRAARRADSFVRVARRVLKNTGFKITSKSAGKMTEAAWQKRAHHAK